MRKCHRSMTEQGASCQSGRAPCHPPYWPVHCPFSALATQLKALRVGLYQFKVTVQHEQGSTAKGATLQSHLPCCQFASA